VGEKLTRKGDLGWMSGTRATLRNTGSIAGGFGYSSYNSKPNLMEEEEVLSDRTTWDPAIKVPAKTDPKLRVGGFGSCHFGVINFLLGDGSVRGISNQISPATLQQLANRTDEKLLTDRDF
jgi:hypothetical protein